jgi:DNA (cytosine-5)-methyltransferase 1
VTRPLLLDLFCGAGGAAMGYHRAGFDVIGVDIHPQPRYPFEFIRRDAMGLLENVAWAAHMKRATPYAVIHASPPCQRYSDLAKRNGNADGWPDLIPLIRRQLKRIGLPWVIENVGGAPLINPITLCGTMFAGVSVIRHRGFESNTMFGAPVHLGKHPLVYTLDKRKAHYGRLDQNTSYVQVTGGGNATVANKARAMGIDWMIGRELNEAIPPAYTEYIGRQLIGWLS